MQIKSLKLTNFFSHKDTFFEFSKDASVSIVGKNGSGKSSIIEGVYYALTGKLFRLSNLADSVHDGAESNSVEIIVVHRDREFSILREYYANNPLRKKYLLVRSRPLDGSSDWTAISSRAVNKEWNVSEHLFGVDAESFRYAPVVAQGDIDSFGLMTKSDKRTLIINLLLEGKIASKVAKEIKASLNTHNSNLAEVTAEKNIYSKDSLTEEQILDLSVENEKLKEQIEKLDSELNNKRLFGRNILISQIIQTKYDLKKFESNTFVSNVKKYQDDYLNRIARTKLAIEKRKSELNIRLEEYRDRYRKLEIEIAPIQKVEEELDLYKKKSKKLLDKRKERDELISRLSVLEKIVDNGTENKTESNKTCLFCGRPMSKQDVTNLIEYIKKTENETAQIKRELKEIDKFVATAQEAQTMVSRKAAQLSYLKQKKEEFDEVREKGKSIRAKLDSPGEFIHRDIIKNNGLADILASENYKQCLQDYILYKKIKDALFDFNVDEMQDIVFAKYINKTFDAKKNLDITEISAELNEKRQTLAINELQVRKSHQAQEFVRLSNEKIEELKQQIKSDELLYDVLSPTTGAFALALDDILGDLNRITTRYATIIDNDVLAIEFISRKFDDDGSETPTLDIKIVRKSSGTRTFSQLSGGEKSKISFAMRIALSTLLLNNKEIEFLILDEALVYLDLDSRSKVIELIKTMAIPQILIISHDEDLANAYTDILYVEKNDGASSARYIKG